MTGARKGVSTPSVLLLQMVGEKVCRRRNEGGVKKKLHLTTKTNEVPKDERENATTEILLNKTRNEPCSIMKINGIHRQIITHKPNRINKVKY